MRFGLLLLLLSITTADGAPANDHGGDWHPDYDDGVPAGTIAGAVEEETELPAGYIPAEGHAPAGGGDWDGAEAQERHYRDAVYGRAKVSYEEIEKSYSAKVKDGFSNVWFGIVLFILAFPLLIFNESNYVTSQKALYNTKRQAVVMNGNEINETNEGKVVLVSGMLRGEKLVDKKFDVRTGQAVLKLSRKVEMWQWKETRHTERKEQIVGANTKRIVEEERFEYSKIWSEKHIDSSCFKDRDHKNPPLNKVGNSQTWVASEIRLGEYILDESFHEKIRPNEEIKREILKWGGDPKPAGDERKVGDTRIIHSVANEKQATILAKQVGGRRLEKYIEPATNRNVTAFEDGNVSLDEIIGARESGNGILVWVLRILGFLMMWAGLLTIWEPLVAIVDVIPVVGAVVGFARDVGTGIAALIITVAVVMIAWLFYRPMIALAVITACLAVVYHKQLAAYF